MADLVYRLRNGTTSGTGLRWQVTGIHLEAAAEIESLRAEVARCHARLEIDHYYVRNEFDELDRVDVPLPGRLDIIDGIECRDATIQGLDKQVDSLRAENQTLKSETAKLLMENQTAREVISQCEGALKGLHAEKGYAAEACRAWRERYPS